MKAWCDGAGGGTAGLHPTIVPSSLAKRKRAGPLNVPSLITKLALPLNTMPVGLPGTCTTSDGGLPAPSYRVDVPESALATHQRLPMLRAMPHELIRFRSVFFAGTAPPETRLCTVNDVLLA